MDRQVLSKELGVTLERLTEALTADSKPYAFHLPKDLSRALDFVGDTRSNGLVRCLLESETFRKALRTALASPVDAKAPRASDPLARLGL